MSMFNYLKYFIAIGWVVVFCGSVHAQGFMIKPMSVVFTARPGAVLQRQFTISNTSNTAIKLRISSVWLMQSSDGGITAIDPKPEKQPPAYACNDWASLSENSIVIQQLGESTMTLKLNVPLSAHGFYGMALILDTAPPDNSRKGLATVIRFVIPIVVTVQGPPAHELVKAQDVSMHFNPGDATHPKTTRVSLQVQNNGDVMSKVSGKVTILTQSADKWRRLTEIVLSERNLFPGNQIDLAKEIQRRLPSGTYKLQGVLQVAGQTRGTIEREISFAGDPTVTIAASDVTLQADPAEIDTKITPNARRSIVVTLRNPGNDPLDVQCVPEIPKSLSGVIYGTLTGESLDCHSWCSFDSPALQLQGGEQRRIRVNFSMPADAAERPNYYANLHLTARYADGQNAGELIIPTRLQNTTVKTTIEPMAKATRLELASQDDTHYSVTACFSNIGLVDFVASVNAAVLTPGIKEVKVTVPLTRDNSCILPLGTPDFSGSLDFAQVPAGVYHLVAVMKYDKKEVSQELPIKVEVAGKKKLVTVIDLDEKNTDGVTDASKGK